MSKIYCPFEGQNISQRWLERGQRKLPICNECTHYQNKQILQRREDFTLGPIQMEEDFYNLTVKLKNAKEREENNRRLKEDFYLADLRIRSLKAINKKTGLPLSDILMPAIDDYWENFERKEKRR